MRATKKLIGQTELKTDGNLFYNMYRYRPYKLSDASPDKVRELELQKGDWGKVSSLVLWKFIHDGRENICSEIVDTVDEENKIVINKVVKGDLLDFYETFKFILQVDTKNGNNTLNMALEYEKISEDIPDPYALLDLCLDVLKEVDAKFFEIEG